MPFKSADSLLPLTPISFEILLALLDGERHGYAILQAVEARLSSTLPLRTGTVYRALARLLDEELTERSGGEGAGAPARPWSERRASIQRTHSETRNYERRTMNKTSGLSFIVHRS